MNVFQAARVLTSTVTKPNNYELAFEDLCNQIEIPLLSKSQGFLVKELRNKYEGFFRNRGENLTSRIKFVTLQNKIVQKCGNRVSILD